MFYAVINYQFKTSELRTANNAQNTQHKLGVAFSYLNAKTNINRETGIQRNVTNEQKRGNTLQSNQVKRSHR